MYKGLLLTSMNILPMYSPTSPSAMRMRPPMKGKSDLLPQNEKNAEQKGRIRAARIGDENAVPLRENHARAGQQPFGAPGEREKGRTGSHYPALPVPAVLVFSAVMNLVN